MNVYDNHVTRQPGRHVDAILDQLDPCQPLVLPGRNPGFLHPMGTVQIVELQAVRRQPAGNLIDLVLGINEIRTPVVAPMNVRKSGRSLW